LVGKRWPTVKPDDDNYCKALDALNGVVWDDDCQRCRTLIVKEYAENPGLIVEVFKLD
jgi:Holliday junction resolvase RusA-like endonuclease